MAFPDGFHELLVRFFVGPHALRLLQNLSRERLNLAAQHDYRAQKLQAALLQVDVLLNFQNQLPHGTLVAVLLTVVLILAVHHALRCVSNLECLEAAMILESQQQQQSHIHSSTVDSGSDGSSHSGPSVVHGADVSVKSRGIAQGSFSNLHAATVHGGHDTFLFKQMKQFSHSLPELQMNIYREAKMMYEARHPHVVKLHAICLDNPGILMEWCRGGSLDHNNIGARHLANAGAGAVLSALRDAAAAVCCFHSSEPDTGRPLVHNDLKGANVLLSCSEAHGWQVKVADFGMAAWLDPTCGIASVRDVTNHFWVAPEVLVTQASGLCQGPFTVSKASEVWMFGMLMWEVLAGQPLFWQLQEQLEQKWGECFELNWNMAQRRHNPHNTFQEFGPFRLPNNLQYGLSDSEQQLLQQLYEACTKVDPSQRPSMKWVHEQLCHISREHQRRRQQQQQQQQQVLQREEQQQQHGQSQVSDGLRCLRRTQMQQHSSSSSSNSSSSSSNSMSFQGNSACAWPTAEVVKQQPQHQQVDVISQAGYDVQHQPATELGPQYGSAAAEPAAGTAFIRSQPLSKKAAGGRQTVELNSTCHSAVQGAF